MNRTITRSRPLCSSSFILHPFSDVLSVNNAVRPPTIDEQLRPPRSDDARARRGARAMARGHRRRPGPKPCPGRRPDFDRGGSSPRRGPCIVRPGTAAELVSGPDARMEDCRRRSASHQGPCWSDDRSGPDIATDPAASLEGHGRRPGPTPRPCLGTVGAGAAIDLGPGARLGDHCRRPAEAAGTCRPSDYAVAELASGPDARMDDHPRANSTTTWSCPAAGRPRTPSGHRYGTAPRHHDHLGPALAARARYGPSIPQLWQSAVVYAPARSADLSPRDRAKAPARLASQVVAGTPRGHAGTWLQHLRQRRIRPDQLLDPDRHGLRSDLDQFKPGVPRRLEVRG
jgi:hypothetical protein